MKIGKLNKKSGIFKVLLGLAVAGALLLTSCQNIFDMADQKPQDSGYGYVVVNLEDAAARTVRPGGDFSLGDGSDLVKFYKFVYKFTGVANDGTTPLNIEAEWDTSTADTSKPFYLPVGKYKLSVEGIISGDAGTTQVIAATGVYKGENGEEVFQVNANVPTTVNVALKGVMGATDIGTITFKITLPAGSAYVFKLQQYSPADGKLGNPISVNFSGANPTTSASNVTATYTGPAGSAGSYLFSGRINTEDGKYGGFAEAVHVYKEMTTEFVKDFTVTGGLAKITDPKDAIDILKTEIKDWFNPAPAGTNIFPSVKAIEYLDSTGAVKPVGDFDIGGTIRVNYIGTQMSQITNLNSSGTNAFIKLQGGWTVIKRGTDDASTWNFPATSGAVFTLENRNITTNPAVATSYLTYKVELRPVAEFRVSFGKDVGTDENRALNEFKDVLGNEIEFDKAFTAANPQLVRTGIIPIGVTSIKVTSAAVTITEVTTPPQTSEVPQPVVGGVVTPAFNAASKVYDLKIYETPEKQLAAAIDRLQLNITGKPKTGTPTEDPWVDSTVRVALAKIEPQEEKDLIVPPSTTAADARKGTVIYYVASRLPATSFPINVPKDPRWDISNNWTLTNPSIATAPGDYKQIGFTPYGGTRTAYDIYLKPVAEYYVDFAPESVGDNPFDAEDDDNLDAVNITGGSVKVTSGPSNATTEFSFTTTNIDGKRFELGNTTIALTEVAIEIDGTTATTDYTDNFENVYKSPLSGPTAQLSDVVGYTATNTASSGSYTLTGATSREYRIKVYPSIAVQRKAAQDLLVNEDTATVDRWISNASSLSTPRRRTLTYVAPVGNGLPSSDLVYVSTVVPVLQLPNNTGTPYTTDKGWVALDSATPTYDGYGKKVVPVKFTYHGGIGFEDVIHNFNVIAAAAVKLTFAKLPSGATPATPGSVTVQGLNPGLGTAFTSSPAITADTTVLIGSGDEIGTANKVQVNSTGSNPNIIFYPEIPGLSGNKSSDVAITAVPGTPIASKEYAFIVYPSTKDQVDDVTAKLKSSLTSLEGWGSFTSTTSVSGVANTAAGALDSTFQIIGGFPNVNTLVPASGAFLTSDYDDTITHGTIGSGADIDADKGTRTDTIKFLAIGGTAAAGASTTPTPNQELWYKFKLVQVARYTVNFMAGPILPASQTQGNVQIVTFEPGTGANRVAGPVGISQSTSKVYVGGIGTAATVEITSTFADGSIFTTNIKADGTVNNGQSSPVTALEATTGLSSADFVINIYPTEADQKRQVVAALSASSNTNATFFSTTELAKIKSTTIRTLSGDISEFQYLAPSAPTPDAVKLTGLLNPGLGYELATGDSSTDSVVSFGATKLGITFKPVKPSASAAKVYDFRRIPVGRFTVEYATDSLGNLAARGTVRVIPVTPSTSTPNKDTLTFGASTTKQEGIVQLGTGQVTIRIDSPTAGDYTTVLIQKAFDNSIVKTLSPPTTNSNGVLVENNVYTFIPSGNDFDFDYKILVVKTN